MLCWTGVETDGWRQTETQSDGSLVAERQIDSDTITLSGTNTEGSPHNIDDNTLFANAGSLAFMYLHCVQILPAEYHSFISGRRNMIGFGISSLLFFSLKRKKDWK